MESFQTLIQKLLKFGIVGLSGICVDFFITWMLKEKLRLNKYVANAAGFSVAVVSNFFLNYVWTFKGTITSVPAAFGLFFAIAFIGLLLNSCFIYTFHELRKINFYLSKTGAIIFVFLWNFSANYFFNFHSISK